jgi:hypothetical protein
VLVPAADQLIIRVGNDEVLMRLPQGLLELNQKNVEKGRRHADR